MAPEIFEIVDISSPDFSAENFHLQPEAVNKHMHIITPEGKVMVGIDAFSHIWSRLKHYSWASRVIQWPIVRPVALVAYEIFASYIRPILPKRKWFKK